MSREKYGYRLPNEQIAQKPVEPRSAAKLLDGRDGNVVHRRVADLPDLLAPGDLLVVNDSRVLPARLRLQKETGGHVEVLLLEQRGDGAWEALVRPGRRVPPGTVLSSADGRPVVEVLDRLVEGRRVVRLLAEGVPEELGTVALPPYIREPLADPDRYQTVYAARPGSVAAPTAGLHLTDELLSDCRARGIAVATVDLAVGLGTFRPITAERIEDHRMHAERYDVPAETMDACRDATRVVAVGTTTLRALESAARGPLAGRTELFVTPGFEFQVVDVLLTNFHLPHSSLLVLLAAFCGERWRDLYDVALAEDYRFLSFGDAMLVGRAQ
ncbi:MAG: S-adenosylmethionine:tRNA ribosyltransferase-isomerase [Actinomycetota bacterium]